MFSSSIPNVNPFQDDASPLTSSVSEKSTSCLTQEKVLKVATFILGISLLSLTIMTLIIKFPTVSNIFYSVFGITSLVSLATIAITYVKCKNPERQALSHLPVISKSRVQGQESSNSEKSSSSNEKPAPNPFEGQPN